MGELEPYPQGGRARDEFVLSRRGSRPLQDPWRHQGLIVEDERAAGGGLERIATVLLTGRECPWRCAMCDLWRYTTAADTPLGAIAAQVSDARSALRHQPLPVTAMKLYNAGSFFDPRAVPDADYEGVAAALAGLSRVVVESHPALVGPRVQRFLDALGRNASMSALAPRLEVGMGLETAHPVALDRLNKRFSLANFRRAADTLTERGVDLRVFLLVAPPFIPSGEQDDWLLRSIDAAFSCGAAVVSLVPTRSGNGAMEALASSGTFSAPTLDDIERSLDLAFEHTPPDRRLFVDLWDLERFGTCGHCLTERRTRLHTMNLDQVVLPRVPCSNCAHGASA